MYSVQKYVPDLYLFVIFNFLCKLVTENVTKGGISAANVPY